MSLNLKKEVEHLNFEEEKPYQSAAVSIEVWLGGSTGKISPELKAVKSFEKHIYDINQEITGVTNNDIKTFF